MLAYLDRGAEAAKTSKQAASDRFEHIARNSATLTALALYADTAALTGSSGPASILYEPLEPWADQVVWNGVIGYGHARMWLGLLAACIGDHEHTDEHLAFACDFQETHGLLLWAARAHLGWAQALAGRGDAARAREHAARALELSREHGYGASTGRAADLPNSASSSSTIANPLGVRLAEDKIVFDTLATSRTCTSSERSCREVRHVLRQRDGPDWLPSRP